MSGAGAGAGGDRPVKNGNGNKRGNKRMAIKEHGNKRMVICTAFFCFVPKVLL